MPMRSILMALMLILGSHVIVAMQPRHDELYSLTLDVLIPDVKAFLEKYVTSNPASSLNTPYDKALYMILAIGQFKKSPVYHKFYRGNNIVDKILDDLQDYFNIQEEYDLAIDDILARVQPGRSRSFVPYVRLSPDELRKINEVKLQAYAKFLSDNAKNNVDVSNIRNFLSAPKNQRDLATTFPYLFPFLKQMKQLDLKPQDLAMLQDFVLNEIKKEEALSEKEELTEEENLLREEELSESNLFEINQELPPIPKKEEMRQRELPKIVLEPTIKIPAELLQDMRTLEGKGAIDLTNLQGFYYPGDKPKTDSDKIQKAIWEAFSVFNNMQQYIISDVVNYKDTCGKSLWEHYKNGWKEDLAKAKALELYTTADKIIEVLAPGDTIKYIKKTIKKDDLLTLYLVVKSVDAMLKSLVDLSQANKQAEFQLLGIEFLSLLKKIKFTAGTKLNLFWQEFEKFMQAVANGTCKAGGVPVSEAVNLDNIDLDYLYDVQIKTNGDITINNVSAVIHNALHQGIDFVGQNIKSLYGIKNKDDLGEKIQEWEETLESAFEKLNEIKKIDQKAYTKTDTILNISKETLQKFLEILQIAWNVVDALDPLVKENKNQKLMGEKALQELNKVTFSGSKNKLAEQWENFRTFATAVSQGKHEKLYA
jgi:hypothetical protein